MKDEKSKTDGFIQVHDIVVVRKHQRTKEDGTKRGYSWGKNTELGMVTEISDSHMAMTKPDGEDDRYDFNDTEDDYFYTISKGSEFEYQKAIDADIVKKVEVSKKADADLKTAMQWRHDFEHTISFFGKLGRFVKQFSK